MAGVDQPGYIEAFARAHKNNKLITRIYSVMQLSSRRQLDQKIKEEGLGVLKEFVYLIDKYTEDSQVFYQCCNYQEI